ncbi:MAG: hypothetical protein EBZ67_11970 [Chitinophagia bacterium]|nr:hypothetical protein [Chitinophagia bacterium]
MKNTRNTLLALLAVFVLQVGGTQAQPDTPPTDGGPGCCPDSPDGDPNGDPPGDPGPTAVPFDGGISLLLAAGAAYGVRRSARKRAEAGK